VITLTDQEKAYFREVYTMLIREYPPKDVQAWITKSGKWVLQCCRNDTAVVDCAWHLRPEIQAEISRMVDDLLSDA
jgi:hypothetical protein